MVGTQMKKEDPLEPNSIAGMYRSSIAQMEIYRDRPTPVFVFMISLCIWSCAIWRMWQPMMASPGAAGACLTPQQVFFPSTQHLRSYLLHILWPLEPGYIRGFLSSVALMIQGYAFEYETGTLSFAGQFLGIHVASALTLTWFQYSSCFLSLEPAIVGMAVVMHRANPKVYTNGMDKALEVPFAIEPRWHLWAVLAILLLASADYPYALACHAIGLLAGSVCALRDPEAWFEGWDALRGRSPKIGYVVHVALLVFAVLFMPLTAQDMPSDIVGALQDGRAMSWTWWKVATTPSPPLLHMAILGQISPEAMYITKLLLTFALPLLLTPFVKWSWLYCVACVILSMYSMTSPAWKFPHLGFLTLLYLVWGFYKLPNMESTPSTKKYT